MTCDINGSVYDEKTLSPQSRMPYGGADLQ
mgnify:CR=1 FL=1